MRHFKDFRKKYINSSKQKQLKNSSFRSNCCKWSDGCVKYVTKNALSSRTLAKVAKNLTFIQKNFNRVLRNPQKFVFDASSFQFVYMTYLEMDISTLQNIFASGDLEVRFLV